MWKKDDEQTAQPTAGSTQRVASPRPSSGQGTAKATIGPSITIDGDVSGSEDLLIQGRITGSITLDDHAVGVGTEGRVKADIVGRLITVEGQVEGDLTAQEQIVLRGTARVKGDIKAPRVVLEDGATFRGLVDMGAPPTKSDEERASSGSKAKDASSSKGATSSAAGGDSGKEGKDGLKGATSSSDENGKAASAPSKSTGKSSGTSGTSTSSGSGRPSANA
jgi:cytoskeletal protein CcmA (bactofilin family)